MLTRQNITLTEWAPTSHEDVDALIGVNVFTQDGEQVGTFKAAHHPNADFSVDRDRHYFLLDPGLMKSWFGGLEETYLPESAIAGFTDDGVYLNLTEEQIKQQSWAAPADLSTYRRV